jgi:hypothetical protein
MLELPLFPLNDVVLFPKMFLPLHIFEPRYQEMINRCLDEKLPFGVLLIKEGREVGGQAVPHSIGTAAQINRVERQPDGRMNIVVVGTQRFRVKEFYNHHSYLSGAVETLPFVNGSTKQADELMHRLRPRLIDYVELLGKANNQSLKLDHLPEDPGTLAFLVAIALQVSSSYKQTLLTLPGIPEMLAKEIYLLQRESLILQHMIVTQREIVEMNSGPTGAIFPN